MKVFATVCITLGVCSALVAAGTKQSAAQPQGQVTDPSDPSWGSGSPRNGYGSGWGGGWGWGGDTAIQTLLFVGLPLLLIPLLFCWPYLAHGGGGYGGGGYGGGGGGWGWKRSASDGKTFQATTDALAKQILPKLGQFITNLSKNMNE